MDKISIIVPTYNVEQYISRCINSIIAQSYKKIEIVIIDDGSTDNTVNEIKKISDNRIKLITKRNEGVSVARNTGLDVATGKYICFVDADDWLEKDYIEKMYNIMLKEDVDCIRCDYYRNYFENISYNSLHPVKELNNIKIMQNTNEMKKAIENFYLEKIPCYVWLLFIKRDLIHNNNIKFEKNIAMMEDTIFYMDILSKCNSIYLYDEQLYHYFCNSSSASKSIKNIERNIFYRLLVLNKIKNIFVNDESFKEYEINTVHVRAILNYIYKLSIYDNKSLKNMCNNLHSNSDFMQIIDKINYNYLPLQDRIQVKLFRKKSFIMLVLYFKVRQLLKKIKDVVLKRKE